MRVILVNLIRQFEYKLDVMFDVKLSSVLNLVLCNIYDILLRKLSFSTSQNYYYYFLRITIVIRNLSWGLLVQIFQSNESQKRADNHQNSKQLVRHMSDCKMYKEYTRNKLKRKITFFMLIANNSILGY